MKNIKGLFPAINAVIHTMESEGRGALDKELMEEELRKTVDMSMADREWLEHIVLDLMMGIALSQAGYYSPIRGSRLFINLKRLKSKAFLEQIKGNKRRDKEAVEKVLEQICKREGEMDNQLCFDESFDETGEYKQTPSEEAMLSILKDLAISPAKGDAP